MIFFMKPETDSKTFSGWSLCGEWPQSGSFSNSQGPPAWRPIASSCAMVPYSSSSPWMARIGQVMCGRQSSMFQARKSGCSQMSFQP
jgi:hypothetical protein